MRVWVSTTERPYAKQGRMERRGGSAGWLQPTLVQKKLGRSEGGEKKPPPWPLDDYTMQGRVRGLPARSTSKSKANVAVTCVRACVRAAQGGCVCVRVCECVLRRACKPVEFGQIVRRVQFGAAINSNPLCFPSLVAVPSMAE